MIEFFQITGSASFAVRMALEEAGAEYEEVNIHPRRPRRARRASPRSIRSRRVPALRDGDVTVYETGAVLLVLADRFPVLGPPLGTPERADLYRWILWLADTLHPAWWPLMKSPSADPEPEAGAAARARGRESMDAHGSYLERQLARGPWCLGETFSVADLYLYMLVGWEQLHPRRLPGRRRARAARTTRAWGRALRLRSSRELDDLDERQLRHHPELRAGRPI